MSRFLCVVGKRNQLLFHTFIPSSPPPPLSLPAPPPSAASTVGGNDLPANEASVRCMGIAHGNRPNRPFLNLHCHHHSLFHSCFALAALDMVEDRLEALTGKSNNSYANSSLFLGRVFSMDDMRVFAFASTTGIKILLVVTNYSSNKEEEGEVALDLNGIEDALSEVFQLFVAACQNPFQPLNAPLVASESFSAQVQKVFLQLYHQRTK